MATAIAMRLKGFGARGASSAETRRSKAQDEAACQQAATAQPEAPAAHVAAGAPAIPLAFVAANDQAVVSKVRGSEDVQHHLENLGFVEGATVRVVCETAGNLIVEIKGAQVALDRSIAMKVSVVQ